MAVNDAGAELRRDLVELVREVGHLVGAILVAGEHLVNRIDNNGNVVLLGRPPDQLRRQLIHWHRLAPQVPDIDITDMPAGEAQGCIHILETVQAARPVKL
ncbi:hypothetical protein D3C75_548350 [compost metagenome]